MDDLKMYINDNIEYYSTQLQLTKSELENRSFEDFLISHSHNLFQTERMLRFFTHLKDVVENESELGVKDYLNRTKESAIRRLLNNPISTSTNPMRNVLNQWEIEFVQEKIQHITSMVIRL